MKKLTLLFTIFFAVLYCNAQNVAINNDGTSATSSAMLDVKSTTKGFMMPRMTTAQRTTIQSPALGLLVFDTDTKTVWAYDGSSWKNLYTSGGLTLPFSQTINQAGAAFNITNAGTAILGVSSNVSTAAINGANNSTGGIGVFGSSGAASGTGVIGQSISGTGVFGNSTDGVGVKASSTNGLALQVNGNLKIAGGNTNPTNGAVLTSDANGNAVWKTNRVAFRGFDINGSYLTIPPFASQQIYYAGENYDFSGGFIPFPNDIPKPANASTFAIPIDGVYHFDASANLFFDENDFDAHTIISLMLDRGGSVSELGYAVGVKKPVQMPSFQTGTHYNLKFSGDFLLFPGDKVYVVVTQFNEDDETATIGKDPIYAFTGHLVVAY